jgi:hypothetical protein
MFFNSRKQLIQNKNADRTLAEEGIVKCGRISTSTIHLLSDLYNKLRIPDSYGFGFNVGLNTEEKHLRQQMQNEITSLIEKELLAHFINRKVFTATFMNKVPSKQFLLPPHQDWTYTKESINDSVMCWIPLTDIQAENGALCYLPHSHKLFSYDRAFPLSYMPSAVNKLNYKLMPYMKPIFAMAGEIIIINHKTVHASLPNLTDQERVAVGLSIAPESEPFIIKALNPLTNGKTAQTFKVDRNFLVNYRHVDLTERYDAQKSYEFEYELIEEEPLKLPEISLRKVEKFACKKGIEKDESFAKNFIPS